MQTTTTDNPPRNDSESSIKVASDEMAKLDSPEASDDGGQKDASNKDIRQKIENEGKRNVPKMESHEAGRGDIEGDAPSSKKTARSENSKGEDAVRIGSILADGMQSAAHEWMTCFNAMAKRNADVIGEIMHAKDPASVVSMQSDLWRQNVTLWLGGAAKASEAMGASVKEASGVMASRNSTKDVDDSV